MGLIEKLFGSTKRMAYEDYPHDYEHEIWVRDTGQGLEFSTSTEQPHSPYDGYGYAWQMNKIKLYYRARREVKDD